MDINHEQLKTHIKECYKKEQPLFIWGATGIGKSESVRAVAQELAKEKKLEYMEEAQDDKHFGLIDVRISQLDPCDLRGLPKLDNCVTRWLSPSWLPTKGQGILFFDELNLAPPSIQASAYQLILDRKLGEYVLPKGWTVIAAGNRQEDKANVFDMGAPLKNRFAHTTLKIPSDDEWLDWFMVNGGDSRISAFIKFKPTRVFNFDAQSKDNAFCTPRSWAKCSKLIEGITDETILKSFVASMVGEATAIEMMAFLKLSKKYNIDEFLKHPKKIEEITAIDEKYSIITGIVEKYKKDKKKLPQCTEICIYMQPEFSIFLLRMLKAINENYFENTLPTCKAWKELSEKYSKYLI